MSDHPGLLPDEIISEILSPALKVSDEVFSDTSDISPFANYSESTSAYLLVCKSWLRVATPLLYNVVILRSKAQAKALSLALSKNGQLGHFIKKLRVEGGYGAPMRIILKCSPNISDLFVSLEIYSSDNTSGFCKGLPLINPSRLILRDFEYRRADNKMISQLMSALVECMSKWDRLCVFDCPYANEYSVRVAILVQPLVDLKRLHTLTIPGADSLSWAYSMFKQCPLQVIHIKKPLHKWDRSYLPFDKDPVLMGLLKFSESPAFGKTNAQDPMLDLPHIAPSLNPSFTPLAGAPKEVHDTIWGRILYFALSVPELAENPAPRHVPRRLPILLASKTFNRLGLPYYYSHVLLKDPSAIPKFVSVLSNNPYIGPCVRSVGPTVVAWDGSEDASDIADDGLDVDNDSSGGDLMLTILSQTNGLVRMGSSKSITSRFLSDSFYLELEKPISWDAFEAVAQCSGSTLRQFSVRIGTCLHASATVFSDLTALQTLEWRSESTIINMTDTPSNGFPKLEELGILQTSQSFLTALSLMQLKSLRRVVLSNITFADIFLKAHGPKLTELELPYKTLRALKVEIFEVCPNLESISTFMRLTTDDVPDVDDFHAPQAVPSLVKIILNAPYWTRHKDVIAAWERFFIEFKSQCFPNLREIEVKCCLWPTSERDIAKSYWVRWAEIMLERNINLTDKNGKKWRPRLKVK